MSITRSDCTGGVSNHLDKTPEKPGHEGHLKQEHECSLGGAINKEQRRGYKPTHLIRAHTG